VRKGQKSSDDTFQPYFKRRKEFPDELFYFMDPEMLWDNWDLLQSFSPRPIAPRIPSTGFIGSLSDDLFLFTYWLICLNIILIYETAIKMAMRHCKLLDLVGFTPTVRFKRGRGGNHYFDKRSTGEWGSFNPFHPKTAEMSLLYKLNTLPDKYVFVNGVMRLPTFIETNCDKEMIGSAL
jgi:hypothetical protein